MKVAAQIVFLSFAMTLSGCGDSTPELSSESGGSAAPTAAAKTVALPSSGQFVEAAIDPVLSPARVGGDCNLDTLNGQADFEPELPRDAAVVLAGWMGDGKTGATPNRVQVVLRGTKTFVLDGATGDPRPDVAQAKHTSAFASSGFAIKADLKLAEPGRYQAWLLGFVGAETVACDTHKTISVGK